MQHHPQMSTATKVELELARQRAEKAMAGETGLQQTWRGLPRQHRTGAPCAVLAGSPAVYGCSAAPSQQPAAAGGSVSLRDGEYLNPWPKTARSAGFLHSTQGCWQSTQVPCLGAA